VFENTVIKKIFGPTMEKITGGRENAVMRRFEYFLFTSVIWKDETTETWRVNGRDRK
jgi:hypothetical protein